VRHRVIDLSARTTAAPSSVYSLLAEGASWPHWSPIDAVELERAGDPPPEGVGAVRVLHRGRTAGRDEIVELVPDRRLAYRSLSGVPVRDYLGEVDVVPDGDGSAIRWRASFVPKVRGSGWLVERGIRRFLDACVRGLADHAAELDAPDPTDHPDEHSPG
jgi:hypothetical protein